MADSGTQRLAYLDWMRGFACLAMFQTHCYDSWLGGSARHTSFFGWSQLGGTLPAPLFLFLAGISCALQTERMRSKCISGNQIASTMIRRGAEIYALGLLFRVQEFVLGLPGAPWTDLLRADVLNIIGLSIVFMGVVCRVAQGRVGNALLAAGVALGIALATPALWTTWRPRWLPWYLESYINGVHTFNVPQPWLFPIFPWTAFAFAGLAVGLLLFGEWSFRNPARATAVAAGAGVGMFFLSRWLDGRHVQLYAVYDYWHTSPNFFLARVGILMIITWAAFAWCRWGPGSMGFSPLIQMGKASLVVYWVHIEFVYGRFSILPKRAQTIPAASLGLLTIFVAMVLLATLRARWKGRGNEIAAWLRGAPRPATNG
ncbi:MAG TPA: heparan-alpha-glucosaminide N-acetyltransferase domain-containing protein [Candidatus Acidoferrales bacterium]|nr:heparan-alpha-glucosaminide N-acetyltransferase domain-containing protein [Candidatus Acidoferrales bacterium]